MESKRISQFQSPVGSAAVDSKALAHRGGAAIKALGGYSDPALVQWFEQATAYYNAVMAGDPNTPAPSQTEWNDFLAQLQWAQQQLGYGQPAWDPGMGGMGGAPLGGPQQGQTNQFGGMTGTMDNWVYTNGKSEIGFTGNGTHDVWSNEFILNVAPVSAKVTIEYTTDTRFQPPEQVAKIVVTDPATGTEAVYFVHDFDPAAGDTIKINTPDVSQLNDDAGIATWGEFTQASAGGSKPDASIPGEEQPDGSLRYEPEFAGETVNFWAQPGEDQTHVVYADANISVKPSDEVKFAAGSDGEILVTVTHSDGSTDTYKVQKGYDVNVNVNEEYIQGEIPASIQGRVSINGAAEAAEGSMDGAAILESLLSATGRSEAQLLTALKSAGYGDMTLQEFREKLGEGDFTNPLTDQALRLLTILDPTLAGLVNDCQANNGDRGEIIKDIQERLVELLGMMDPNSIYSPGESSGYIDINGETFAWSINNAGDLYGEYL